MSQRGSLPLPGFPANTASGVQGPTKVLFPISPGLGWATGQTKGLGAGAERKVGAGAPGCSRASSHQCPLADGWPLLGFVGGGAPGSLLAPASPQTLRGQPARWTQGAPMNKGHIFYSQIKTVASCYLHVCTKVRMTLESTTVGTRRDGNVPLLLAGSSCLHLASQGPAPAWGPPHRKEPGRRTPSIEKHKT